MVVYSVPVRRRDGRLEFVECYVVESLGDKCDLLDTDIYEDICSKDKVSMKKVSLKSNHLMSDKLIKTVQGVKLFSGPLGYCVASNIEQFLPKQLKDDILLNILSLNLGGGEKVRISRSLELKRFSTTNPQVEREGIQKFQSFSKKLNLVYPELEMAGVLFKLNASLETKFLPPVRMEIVTRGKLSKWKLSMRKKTSRMKKLALAGV